MVVELALARYTTQREARLVTTVTYITVEQFYLLIVHFHPEMGLEFCGLDIQYCTLYSSLLT